eukprot:Filipodium_phascolosomae@DN2148_c0_g1_i1.p1
MDAARTYNNRKESFGLEARIQASIQSEYDSMLSNARKSLVMAVTNGYISRSTDCKWCYCHDSAAAHLAANGAKVKMDEKSYITNQASSHTEELAVAALRLDSMYECGMDTLHEFLYHSCLFAFPRSASQGTFGSTLHKCSQSDQVLAEIFEIIDLEFHCHHYQPATATAALKATVVVRVIGELKLVLDRILKAGINQVEIAQIVIDSTAEKRRRAGEIVKIIEVLCALVLDWGLEMFYSLKCRMKTKHKPMVIAASKSLPADAHNIHGAFDHPQDRILTNLLYKSSLQNIWNRLMALADEQQNHGLYCIQMTLVEILPKLPIPRQRVFTKLVATLLTGTLSGASDSMRQVDLMVLLPVCSL